VSCGICWQKPRGSSLYTGKMPHCDIIKSHRSFCAFDEFNNISVLEPMEPEQQ